jgi:class 3 adenylate cyclase
VFDGPARLHTAECDRRGDDFSGIAVNIAARITALADRGDHELRGVPGSWRLFALADGPSAA